MKKKISIYDSFEAQKAEEIKDIMNQSGLERIAQVVAFLKKIYSLEERKTNASKRINFIRT
ncbi:MAG TPA: hypothetical protein PKC40_11955 [Saprospiraceae bacterium]|mgnify:CR=1 FL=1|nr:hypothetical protein [Saprospiraceae bacterium]